MRLITEQIIHLDMSHSWDVLKLVFRMTYKVFWYKFCQFGFLLHYIKFEPYCHASVGNLLKKRPRNKIFVWKCLYRNAPDLLFMTLIKSNIFRAMYRKLMKTWNFRSTGGYLRNKNLIKGTSIEITCSWRRCCVLK